MDNTLKADIIKAIKEAAASIPDELGDPQFECNINLAVKKILSACEIIKIQKARGTFDAKRFKKKQRNNTSGVRGVTFNKYSGKWQAKIGNGSYKAKHLGYFDTMEEAAVARGQAETEMWGQRN